MRLLVTATGSSGIVACRLGSYIAGLNVLIGIWVIGPTLLRSWSRTRRHGGVLGNGILRLVLREARLAKQEAFLASIPSKIFSLGVPSIEKRLALVLPAPSPHPPISLLAGLGKGRGRLGYGDRAMGGLHSALVKIGHTLLFRLDFEAAKHLLNLLDTLGDDLGFGRRTTQARSSHRLLTLDSILLISPPLDQLPVFSSQLLVRNLRIEGPENNPAVAFARLVKDAVISSPFTGIQTLQPKLNMSCPVLGDTLTIERGSRTALGSVSASTDHLSLLTLRLL